MVPSGKIATVAPLASSAWQAANTDLLSPTRSPSDARYTGKTPARPSKGRATGTFHSDALAMNRGRRPRTAATTIGSTKPLPWLAARSAGRSVGIQVAAGDLDRTMERVGEHPGEQAEEAIGRTAEQPGCAIGHWTMVARSNQPSSTSGGEQMPHARAAGATTPRRTPGCRACPPARSPRPPPRRRPAGMPSTPV